MKNQPLYVAFSNQKGGVGKSAYTVLMASYIHYLKGKNVLVVDCDYPQFSIHTMRERDKQTVEKSKVLKQLMTKQFSEIQKKAYTILTAAPDQAKDVADSFLESSPLNYDIVLFDLPGTVNTQGILKSILNMDYLFVPIVSDRMAMQSSLSFTTTIQDFISKNPRLPLKAIHLFWNKVDKRVSADLFNVYNKIMTQLKLNVLKTIMPDTHRYSKELSATAKPFFRCTLFPPSPKLIKGSNLDVLNDEVCKLINL